MREAHLKAQTGQSQPSHERGSMRLSRFVLAPDDPSIGARATAFCFHVANFCGASSAANPQRRLVPASTPPSGECAQSSASTVLPLSARRRAWAVLWHVAPTPSYAGLVSAFVTVEVARSLPTRPSISEDQCLLEAGAPGRGRRPWSRRPRRPLASPGSVTLRAQHGGGRYAAATSHKRHRRRTAPCRQVSPGNPPWLHALHAGRPGPMARTN